MSRRLRGAALTAAVLLILLGLLLGDHSRERTRTTFGSVPSGYGALFDLLTELQLPVARSYARPDDLPAAATVWWIEAPALCTPRIGTQAATPQEAVLQESVPTDTEWWPGHAWVEAGATAVILLPPKLRDGCASIAGAPLPPRVTPRRLKDDGPHQAARDSWRAQVADTDALVHQELSGRIAAQPRQVSTPGLRTFTTGAGWQIAAELDGRPFILEAPFGRGRLVVVADATVLRNAWLDHADAALVAVDLVRAYGVPLFDERAHGLDVAGSAVRYLAGSSALPLFVGLALMALLFAWRGAAVPPRSLAADGVAAPTLEIFVESLARLYAANRDYTQVMRQYRAVTAVRLRRHFRLPSETSLGVLADCVRRSGRVQPETMHWLADDAVVSGETELRAAVGALDRILWEATA